MTNAKDKQVGGTHYKDMPIQPSEFIYRNGLNWYEGNAIKYILRHHLKGGKEDIEKAIHYLELLIEDEYGTDSKPGDNQLTLPFGQIAEIPQLYAKPYGGAVLPSPGAITYAGGVPQQATVESLCNCAGCQWARGEINQW